MPDAPAPTEKDDAVALLRELFYLRMPGGAKVEDMLAETGHDDLWRRIYQRIKT